MSVEAAIDRLMQTLEKRQRDSAPFRAIVTGSVSGGMVSIRRVGSSVADDSSYARIMGFGVSVDDEVICLPFGTTPIILGRLNRNETLPSPLETYSIQGALSVSGNRVIELYASSDSGGSTMNNFTTAQTFTNHQLLIPAGTITRGDMMRVTAWGTYGVTGTPTLTLRLKIDSSTAISSGAVSLSAGGIWTLTATLRYGSSGSPTSQYWAGNISFGAASGTATVRHDNGAPVLSFGVDRTLAIDAAWSAASASNTVTFDRWVVEASTV